jgi:hypothetical protein
MQVISRMNLHETNVVRLYAELLKRGGWREGGGSLAVTQEALLAVATPWFGILRYREESDELLARRVAARVEGALGRSVSVQEPYTVIVRTN